VRRGRHVAVGALEPQCFAELVALLGLEPEWPVRCEDPATWPELRRAISAAATSCTPYAPATAVMKAPG
jgi:alpha-methylacyl-CoA racemase